MLLLESDELAQFHLKIVTYDCDKNLATKIAKEC